MEDLKEEGEIENEVDQGREIGGGGTEVDQEAETEDVETGLTVEIDPVIEVAIDLAIEAGLGIALLRRTDRLVTNLGIDLETDLEIGLLTMTDPETNLVRNHGTVTGPDLQGKTGLEHVIGRSLGVRGQGHVRNLVTKVCLLKRRNPTPRVEEDQNLSAETNQCRTVGHGQGTIEEFMFKSVMLIIG